MCVSSKSVIFTITIIIQRHFAASFLCVFVLCVCMHLLLFLDVTNSTVLCIFISSSKKCLHHTWYGILIFFSVNVLENRISIFDTGSGMDNSDESSIAKWYVIPILFALLYIYIYFVLTYWFGLLFFCSWVRQKLRYARISDVLKC